MGKAERKKLIAVLKCVCRTLKCTKQTCLSQGRLRHIFNRFVLKYSLFVDTENRTHAILLNS